MLKTHDRAAEKIFKMKGVSAVAILAHKLAVGTSNTTDAEGRGPGPAATEKIRRAVKERDSDIEVEAFYSELAQLLTVVGGFFPKPLYTSSTWPSTHYGHSTSCDRGHFRARRYD